MHISIQMIFCLCQGLVGTLHTKGTLVIVNISLLLPRAEIVPRQSSFLWPWVISIFNLSQITMISRADSRTHAKADMHVHAHKPDQRFLCKGGEGRLVWNTLPSVYFLWVLVEINPSCPRMWNKSSPFMNREPEITGVIWARLFLSSRVERETGLVSATYIIRSHSPQCDAISF